MMRKFLFWWLSLAFAAVGLLVFYAMGADANAVPVGLMLVWGGPLVLAISAAGRRREEPPPVPVQGEGKEPRDWRLIGYRAFLLVSVVGILWLMGSALEQEYGRYHPFDRALGDVLEGFGTIAKMAVVVAWAWAGGCYVRREHARVSCFINRGSMLWQIAVVNGVAVWVVAGACNYKLLFAVGAWLGCCLISLKAAERDRSED